MKKILSNWVTILVVVVFLVGFWVMVVNRADPERIWDVDEPFESSNCPDLLVQQGTDIVLLKSTDPSNVLVSFKDMKEYLAYQETQKQNGNDCPVLVLKQEVNTQGEDVYRVYRTPTDPLPLTPPSSKQGPISPPPFSLEAKSDSYAGFDSYNLTVGVYTNIDKIHDSTSKKPESENPMDTNWGGVQVTQTALNNGVYKDNEVYKISYPKPILQVV